MENEPQFIVDEMWDNKHTQGVDSSNIRDFHQIQWNYLQPEKKEYPQEVLARHKSHMARFYEPGVFRQNNCPCQLYQLNGKLIKCDEIKELGF